MTVWPARRGLLPSVMAMLLGFLGSTHARAATHDVSIVGMTYQPASLHVNLGDRIVWRNNDVVPHTVTAADRSFDSGRIDPGQQWTFIVPAAGHVDYACAYHPMMHGTLEAE